MKVKSAGVLPLLAIIIFSSPAFCEKLVEVISPIANLRSLPSATSDSRGIAQKGKRFIVNGESGQWFQIRLYDNTVWIPKSAVNVLESTDPVAPPPAPVAAAGGTNPGGNAAAAAANARTPVPPAAARRPALAPPPTPAVGAETARPGAAPGAQTAASAETPPTGTPTGATGTTEETPLAAPTATTGTTEGTAAAAPPAMHAPAAHAPAAPPLPRPRKAVRPKGGTWVTQFSHMEQEESGKEQYYFQVSEKNAVIYSRSNTGAAALAEAQRRDFFPLLEEAGEWCKIALQDTVGWVERSRGVIVTTPQTTFIDEFLVIIIIAGALILITGIVILTLLLRRKTKATARKSDRFRAMILARTTPQIQCVVSNKSMSLDKYLGVIGFTVKSARDPDAAQKLIARQPPDVVFIDWEISGDIPGTVEVLFAELDEKKQPLAIFYNVHNAAEVPLIPVLFRAYHLGRSFSDHDISKLITPTMLSRTNQKSSASSALEGDIAEGNLPEIMQFIEIGKKSGCLLIETTAPLGMIYFAQGRIVHAMAANNITGIAAINFLLGLKDGKFRFLLNKEPKVSDLNLSTLEVLMEWSKTEDEAHRH